MAQKKYDIINALHFAEHHTTRGKVLVLSTDFETLDMKTAAYRFHIVHTTVGTAAKLLEEMRKAAKAGDLNEVRRLFRQKKIPAGPDEGWMHDGPRS